MMRAVLVKLISVFLVGCYAERYGEFRRCDSNDNTTSCRCSKPSDCRDYTRDRYGFCDIRSGACIYCLYGQHIVGNLSATYMTSDGHKCVRSDTCVEGVPTWGSSDIFEVECVDYFCIREGLQTEELCQCQHGFEMKKMWDGRYRCVDVNECESALSYTCRDLDCINYEGGFKCGCRSGYRLINDTYGVERCEEVDECKDVIGICPQSCVNLAGSYNCTCYAGYLTIYEHGNLSCIDIDECQTGSASCHPLTSCYNTIGSFYCSTPIQIPNTAGAWAITIIPFLAVASLMYLLYCNLKLRLVVTQTLGDDKTRYGASDAKV